MTWCASNNLVTMVNHFDWTSRRFSNLYIHAYLNEIDHSLSEGRKKKQKSNSLMIYTSYYDQQVRIYELIFVEFFISLFLYLEGYDYSK